METSSSTPQPLRYEDDLPQQARDLAEAAELIALHVGSAVRYLEADHMEAMQTTDPDELEAFAPQPLQLLRALDCINHAGHLRSLARSLEEVALAK